MRNAAQSTHSLQITALRDERNTPNNQNKCDAVFPNRLRVINFPSPLPEHERLWFSAQVAHTLHFCCRFLSFLFGALSARNGEGEHKIKKTEIGATTRRMPEGSVARNCVPEKPATSPVAAPNLCSKKRRRAAIGPPETSPRGQSPACVERKFLPVCSKQRWEQFRDTV